MMFQEDCQTLQTLVHNKKITPNNKTTPIRVLNATETTIKDKEHFWHFRDKIPLDFKQKTDEGRHTLSNHIITLVGSSKFTHEYTIETLKIMLLQHAINIMKLEIESDNIINKKLHMYPYSSIPRY